MASRKATRRARATAANGVYTYRGGRKIPLQKDPTRFVVRALPDAVTNLGAQRTQISSSSTRVNVRAADLEKRMALGRAIAPTHHAYQRADSQADFLITDRVLIRLKPGHDDSTEIDALAGKYALLVRERLGPREFLVQLTNDTGMNPVKLVVALTEGEPAVEMAENDLNQHMTRRLTLPTDTHYLRCWHLHGNFPHAEVDPRASARCEQAGQRLDSYGSRDVVVAVTDDGCRLDHGDFNNDKFAGWGYFQGTRLVKNIDPDALGASMYQAGANHGTSCAGVAAGEADGVLTVGAAPGCRLLPIKWESNDTSLFVSDSKLLTVLTWIADKADVVSNSWGIVPDNQFAAMVTERIAQLAQNGGRRGRGIVFLWAAGNEDCPIEFNGNLDIPYTDGWNASGNWVGVQKARRFRNSLVALPGVMHIAALASNGQRSHYSNYGTGIDITAPSSNSHAFWRMSVPGIGVVAATGEGQRYTVAFGGTSSATPLVAGVAGLVISANPLLTAAEVCAILRRTASKNLDFTPYPRTPPASFDPSPTWDISPVPPFASGAFTNVGHADGTWSPWFGHGKVDAEAAVVEAMRLRAPAPVPAPQPGSGISGESTRTLAIPDDNPAGIADDIQLTGQGDVGDVRIEVDIRHTYVGDLTVTLVAPNGTAVAVHRRNGGNQNDLRRSWSTSDTPALSALSGGPIAGTWRLHVRDEAAIDTGSLNGWKLAITQSGIRSFARTDAASTAIPDNNAAGVRRPLVCDIAGRIVDIAVHVDITHTYIGDLSVALLAPSGTRAVLHDRTGGSADNLIRSWAATTAGLTALLGQPSRGTWILEVADRAAVDVGKLNRWGLTLRVS